MYFYIKIIYFMYEYIIKYTVTYTKQNNIHKHIQNLNMRDNKYRPFNVFFLCPSSLSYI